MLWSKRLQADRFIEMKCHSYGHRLHLAESLARKQEMDKQPVSIVVCVCDAGVHLQVISTSGVSTASFLCLSFSSFSTSLLCVRTHIYINVLSSCPAVCVITSLYCAATVIHGVSMSLCLYITVLDFLLPACIVFIYQYLMFFK